jgi:hypothetical protein
LTILSAVRGPGMATTGWQVHLTGRINHAASQVKHQLAVLPGWLATVAVLALAAGPGRRGPAHRAGPGRPGPSPVGQVLHDVRHRYRAAASL